MATTKSKSRVWRWLKAAAVFTLCCVQCWVLGPAVGGALANETFDLFNDDR